MRYIIAVCVLICNIVCVAYNTQYGKITDSHGIKYAPSYLTISNQVKTAAILSEEEYNLYGWYYIIQNQPNPPDGYYVSSINYTLQDSRIVTIYTYEKMPPRIWRYSKLKLISITKEAGKWESVKAFIKESGFEDEFWACQYFEDGNTYLVSATNAAVEAGIATSDEITELLEASRDE